MMALQPLAVMLLAGAAPALASPAPAAGPATCPRTIDVRNVMTVAEFDHSGLDKLSAKQLAALNAWLGRYVHAHCARTGNASPSATAAQPMHHQEQAAVSRTSSAGAAAFGNPPTALPEPKRIESRIVGDFHGWTGDTIFRLRNGQVWKQAGPGFFETDLKSPKVVIKKLLIGYVLQVDGYGKEVFVRRIR